MVAVAAAAAAVIVIFGRKAIHYIYCMPSVRFEAALIIVVNLLSNFCRFSSGTP